MDRRILGFLLVAASCARPLIGGSDPSCVGTARCPVGQSCVAGQCVGGDPGASNDLSVPPVADMAEATLDLSEAKPDLSTAPDLLSSLALDLTPACVATGGDCTYHNNGICCSNYCVYKTNTCK